MRAVWLVPLLLCSIVSSINTAAPKCNFAGCESCDEKKNICVFCQKGWSFPNQSNDCLPCGDGCDMCYFVPLNSQNYRSVCKGSCGNGCLNCDSDRICKQCPKNKALFQGQCFSCGDECSKCEVFQESWAGELKLTKCTGYCGGGCNSCSFDALSCEECDKGYVLVEGKCWPCPTGCNKCIAGQRDMFYRGWGTSCVDAFQPIPTPDPTPTPTPSNDNNNNVPNTNNSNSGRTMQVLAIGGVIAFVLAAVFVIQRNSKSKSANVQQDYAQTMAVERQRQAAMNVPTQNYQYQAPQAYPQVYPQAYNQAYPQAYPQGNQQGYAQF